MRRLQLIQSIFEASNFKTYLEIGCYKGKTFLQVKAHRKIAVDPFFHPIFIKNALIALLKSPQNVSNRYFKATSDHFFLVRKRYLRGIAPLDVVFVDGLHTFEASLKDVLNSLIYLNELGVIVMHDCFPTCEASALPTKHFPTPEDLIGVEGWTGAWSGDVWKTIVYLRRLHSDVLDVYVINSDNGLGIIRVKKGQQSRRLKIDPLLFEAIDALTYNDLLQNANSYLDLKPTEYALDLISTIAKEKNKLC